MAITGSWRIRPFRPGDFSRLIGLNRAINAVHEQNLPTDEEAIRRAMAQPEEDLVNLMLVAEPATGETGEVLGTARAIPTDDPDIGERSYELRIVARPDLESSRLPDDLLAGLVSLLRNREHARDGRAIVRAFVAEESGWRRALFEGAGMRENHQWCHMERMATEPIDEPQGVPGLTMRTYRVPDDDAPAKEAAFAAFADHYGFSPRRWEEEWADWNFRPDTRHDLSWVAVVNADPGKIAGLVTAYQWRKPEGDRPAECLIPYVATVREWRHKGVARNLLLHTLRSLREAGFARVFLNVDAQSLTGATRVYEAAGFRRSEVFLQYESTLDVMKVPAGEQTDG